MSGRLDRKLNDRSGMSIKPYQQKSYRYFKKVEKSSPPREPEQQSPPDQYSMLPPLMKYEYKLANLA